jgi:UDPglucose 6-dehydrogenase
VGPGSVLLACTALTAAVSVGAHVAVMPHVTLTHDDEIDVSRCAYIGAGALIGQQCTVGELSLAGMGTVVTRDVPPREVWVGVPARRLRTAAIPDDPGFGGIDFPSQVNRARSRGVQRMADGITHGEWDPLPVSLTFHTQLSPTIRSHRQVNISVIGCGHLGATHAACMAEIGHEVLGVEIDESKVSILNSGKAWFHEPGLDEMLAMHTSSGRLRFTTNFAEAAEFASVHFIGVATPGLPDGSYDLSQLHAVISSLVPHVRGQALIIGKSTVAPGTAAALQVMTDGFRSAWDDRLEVAWNPEFLREGCAVADTLRPDRIVVGASSATAADTVREIYRPLTEDDVPLLVTNLATAELVKGAANAFLAMKISFINAMADICVATNGDVSALADALGMDPRIGPAFLRAGIGYGGACLPKDVRGLATFADGVGADNATQLLAAVDDVNTARSTQVIELLRAAVGSLSGKRITILGATFKPGTDDVRDSSALLMANRLQQLGATVTVYDPMASANALALFPELAYADSALAAAQDVDGLVVATAWPEFAEVPPKEVGQVARHRVVIDACQGIPTTAWREGGWDVFSLTGARHAEHSSIAARHS